MSFLGFFFPEEEITDQGGIALLIRAEGSGLFGASTRNFELDKVSFLHSLIEHEYGDRSWHRLMIFGFEPCWDSHLVQAVEFLPGWEVESHKIFDWIALVRKET